MLLQKRPLYLQLCDQLAQRIASGFWKACVALPKEVDLAHEFGVSRVTVRKALKQLETPQLVTKRFGRGAFVADPAGRPLARRYEAIYSRTEEKIIGSVQVITVFQALSTDTEARRLELAALAPVYHIRRYREYKGKPYMIEDAVILERDFPELADGRVKIEGISELARHSGILVGPAHECITIVPVLPGIGHTL